MRRKTCGGCGSQDLLPFLDLGSSPLADRFPKTADEPEEWFPLQVAVCQRCWLAQLLEVVDDGLLYGDDYAFHTGSSSSAVAYFAGYAAGAANQFDLDGAFVVEVACNDGTLLGELAHRGARALGVEPAPNVAAAATARGLDVVVAPFGEQTARDIVAERGRADLVIANNVAAHVTDLDDFFAGMAVLVADRGAAVVEVQYVADLLAGNQFDHVYHEHRYFFSLSSLGQVMGRHGLRIRSVTHTEAQGGSIRVSAGHGSPSDWADEDPSLGLRSLPTYQAMQGRVEHIKSRLNELVTGELLAGRKIAGYAASAKSATLLNYCGLGPNKVDHIVDTTPHKIGRFSPGTRIPVVGPSERPQPDVYLILAWNYLAGILRRETAYTASGGRFLVPVPWPVLL